MNEMYFKISSIEKKMDSNKALKTMMKAEITGEILPDAVANKEIVMPSNEIKYPIAFYAIILFLDILIKIIIIH